MPSRSSSADHVLLIALPVIVMVAYVGGPAWDRADGNLLALPFFLLLETVDLLRRALLGVCSLLGLR